MKIQSKHTRFNLIFNRNHVTRVVSNNKTKKAETKENSEPVITEAHSSLNLNPESRSTFPPVACVRKYLLFLDLTVFHSYSLSLGCTSSVFRSLTVFHSKSLTPSLTFSFSLPLSLPFALTFSLFLSLSLILSTITSPQ